MKDVKVTDSILAEMRDSTDNPDLQSQDLSVFEVIALNTKPLTRPGGGTFMNNAVVARSALTAMAESLGGGGSVPLIQNHDKFMSGVTPVGRVFQGNVFDKPDGSSELRVLMYLDGSSQDSSRLINKLNKGITDEVSVGVLFGRAISSETGFDFFGPDATPDNIFDAVDDQGNVMGENGAHVILSDVIDWAELSLVINGAADNAKVVSRAKQRLGQEAVNKLAASGVPFSARYLTAGATQTPKPKKVMEAYMENDKIVETLKELTESLVEAKLAAAKVPGLEASVSELEAKLETANKSLEDFKDLDLKAYKESQSWLDEQVKAALTAANSSDAVPEDFAGKVELIKSCALKAHQLVEPSDPKGAPVNDPDVIQMSDYERAILGANQRSA